MNKNFHDFRMKQAVVATRDPHLFEEYGVKPATARNWIYRGFQTPIHCDEPWDSIVPEAIESRRIRELEEKLAKAEALVELYRSVSETCQLTLYKKHIRDRSKRSEIVTAVAKASQKTGTMNALSSIGLSLSRYKRWKAPISQCQLTGAEKCHKMYPNQLAPSEIQKMERLITSKKYAHYSTKSLHWRAKRDGALSCCADTWYKYIEKYNWQRPHKKPPRKKHPGRVKRATQSNEIIHIDVTHIKCKSGKTYYLQTVLDNYSRYILAWHLSSEISKQNTVDLLTRAARHAKKHLPNSPICYLISDGGSENVNEIVNLHFKNSLKGWKHRIPKLNIRFSNNMLECWFRLLKNTYLNYFPAKSMIEMKRRLKFYIGQYNRKIPLSSLGGRTPIEAYLGTESIANIKTTLREQSQEKRGLRMEENLSAICAGCG